ncbi:hypothetical protein WJX79_004141 [Trebouxia sp. C0005]
MSVGSLCWMFANAKLVVWAADGNIKSQTTASLPYAAADAAVSVAALQAGGVAAAVCTSEGNLSVWPTMSISSGLLQARISQELKPLLHKTKHFLWSPFNRQRQA